MIQKAALGANSQMTTIPIRNFVLSTTHAAPVLTQKPTCRVALAIPNFRHHSIPVNALRSRRRSGREAAESGTKQSFPPASLNIGFCHNQKFDLFQDVTFTRRPRQP